MLEEGMYTSFIQVDAQIGKSIFLKLLLISPYCRYECGKKQGIQNSQIFFVDLNA